MQTMLNLDNKNLLATHLSTILQTTGRLSSYIPQMVHRLFFQDNPCADPRMCVNNSGASSMLKDTHLLQLLLRPHRDHGKTFEYLTSAWFGISSLFICL